MHAARRPFASPATGGPPHGSFDPAPAERPDHPLVAIADRCRARVWVERAAVGRRSAAAADREVAVPAAAVPKVAGLGVADRAAVGLTAAADFGWIDCSAAAV